jgi:hypothetical protein
MRRFLFLFFESPWISESSTNLILESRTELRLNYLEICDQMRISEESSLESSDLWTNLPRLLRKYTTMYVRTQERQYQLDSEQPRFSWLSELVRWRASNNGPFLPNKTVDIRLSDGHNDLLQCKSQECLEPSQYDRDGRCYLALQKVDSTNDECTTQPNPLEAFKWTKSLALSG